jgi:hypothetical protein
LTLTVTERAAEIAGTIRDGAGGMTGQGVVILFPSDRRLWQHWQSRVRAVRPDSSGRFRLDHLGAGEYLIAALADAPYGAWDEPSFLEGLRAQATPVKLAEAAQETIELISLQTFNKNDRR